MWGVEDTQIAVVVVVAAVAVVVVESSEKTLAGVGKKLQLDVCQKPELVPGK